MTLKEGAKLRHYEIHSPIGAGGMGEVFLARDERLGRNVAIFREYDVSPERQRFLNGTLVGDSKAAPPTVILSWTADLKK